MIEDILNSVFLLNVHVQNVHQKLFHIQTSKLIIKKFYQIILIPFHFSSSLPMFMNISPAKITAHRLITPTILNKAQQNKRLSFYNIDSTIYNQFIHQWGKYTILSVTQCMLDLILIVSLHRSLPTLSVSLNNSIDEYKKIYQEIIHPSKCIFNENAQMLLFDTSVISHVTVSENSVNKTSSIILTKSPDILTFYDLIKQNKINTRNAMCKIIHLFSTIKMKNIFSFSLLFSKAMKNIITNLHSTSVTSSSSVQPNITKSRTLVIPKSTSSLTVSNTQKPAKLLKFKKLTEKYDRIHDRSSQTSRYDNYTLTYLNNNKIDQQTHSTPFIDLKPTMIGSIVTTQNTHSSTREENELKQVTASISLNNQSDEIHDVSGNLFN